MALSLGQIFYTLGAQTAGLTNAVTGVRVFGTAVAASQAKAAGFVGALRNLESAAILAVGPLSGVGARIRSVGQLMGSTSIVVTAFAAGVVGAGLALFKLGEAAISSNLRLLAMHQRLTLITGSSAGAAVAFEHLVSLANASGIELGQLASSYSKLAAATKGTALEGDRTSAIFDKMSMLGGNLVLTNEQMDLSFLALEQMISKGTVTMEELRRQLGDQIPGAFQTFARSMHIGTAELSKLIKQGKVGLETLEPFIDELLRTFGIDASKPVDNLQASINKLSTQWLLFSKTMDETFGVSAAWKATIEGLTAQLVSIGTNLKIIIPYIGAAAAGMLVLFAPTVVSGALALVGVIVRLTAAMLGLSLATAATPLGLLSRLAILAVGAGAAKVAFDELNKSMSAVTFDPLKDQVDQYIQSNARFNKSQISTTDSLITETKNRIKIYETELTAYKAQLDAMSQATEDEAMKNFPKQTTLIRGWLGSLFGWDTQQQASGVKDSVNTIDNALQGLEGSLKNLNEIRAQQEGLPDLPDFGKASATQTNAQINRLEKASFALEELRMQVQAMKEGPGAVQFTTDFMAAESAVESFRESLKQTGINQDELNAKVGEFRSLMFEKIDLGPMTAGAKELQDVFINVFGRIADAIATSMVEGTFAIQDFVDIGKKFLEELIAKLIELAIFNPLLNALLGTTQPVLGGMIGNLISGFGAKGMVLGGPTLLSKGGKLYGAGEKGPEAVMPLTRTAGGDLGVKVAGMGSSGPTVVLAVNIKNESKSQIESKENQSGGLDVRIFDRMTAGVLRKRGSLSDKALTQRSMIIRRGA